VEKTQTHSLRQRRECSDTDICERFPSVTIQYPNRNKPQLEWLTSIPWPSTSSHLTALETLKDRQFLSKARSQLDADHYGLDKIKKRLVEYLAIVRMKELAVYAENEKALVLRMDNAPPINRVKGPILL